MRRAVAIYLLVAVFALGFWHAIPHEQGRETNLKEDVLVALSWPYIAGAMLAARMAHR